MKQDTFMSIVVDDSDTAVVNAKQLQKLLNKFKELQVTEKLLRTDIKVHEGVIRNLQIQLLHERQSKAYTSLSVDLRV